MRLELVRNLLESDPKEAARLLLREQDVGSVDLVLIGRDSTRGRPFVELIDDFRRALGKTGVKLTDAAR